MKKTIAILALQGAFFEHEQMLQSLGAETMLIRNLPDWEAFGQTTGGLQHAGLVIPGGESTAMLRIMRDENLLLPLRQAIADGLPVFGTCAGMILLASHVDNDDRERLATMDITVMRNAYGRQLLYRGSVQGHHRRGRDCPHDIHTRAIYHKCGT